MKKDEELVKELLRITRQYRDISARKQQGGISEISADGIPIQVRIINRAYAILRKLLFGDFQDL